MTSKARQKYLIVDPEVADLFDEAHEAVLEWRKATVRHIQTGLKVSESPSLQMSEGKVKVMLDILIKYTQPAGMDVARQRIDQIREVLGAARPSSEAVMLFGRAIHHLPHDLMNRGMHNIVRNRTYKAMPTPAEWLAEVDEALKWRLGLQKALQDSGISSPEPKVA